MRRATAPIGGTELFAGLAAAAAFLAMMLLLHMPLWLGILLAALVYIGTGLLLRRTESEATAQPTEAELLTQIDQLSQRIPNPRVRTRIMAIRKEAGTLRAFLDQHPEKGDLWHGIMLECLQSTLGITRRYVELSRFFDDPGRQSVAQVEELLDQVSTTFAGLRKRLVDEGAADLTAETQVLRTTLQALDEVTILNRGEGSP